MFKGAVCVSPKGAKRQHNRQTKWKFPPNHVGGGAREESREAVTLTEDTDPRPFVASCKASDNSDCETPEIPLSPKEEDRMEREVLTTPALVGDTKSLAMAAIAALNACASSQGEQTPIDMGLFIQWLNNSDTVRKFISQECVRGIEPASTHNKPIESVPFSSKPDQLNLNTSNSDRADANVAISKINAWIASLPYQSSRLVHDGLDVELLVHLFQNPEDIEKRIKEYDASYRSGNLLCASMMTKTAADRKLHAIETTPESSISFRRKNTVEHNSSFITGSSSAPQKILSSSKKMSLIDEEIMLPEATMVPMSPLYSSPSANSESDMKTERIINEYGTFADMRMEPRHMKSLISPVVSFSLPQTKLLELHGASLKPTTNVLPLLPQRNPPLLDIEKRIKEYDVSYRSGNLSASMMTKAATGRKLHAIVTTPESSLSFGKKNTVHEHNSSSITGSSSAPQKIFSSVGTTSKKMSLIDEETKLPEVTMVPMSPLYSSPSANWESDMKTERIINEYGTFDMRMGPTHMKSLISPPVVSFSLPQTKLLELPTTNGLPLLPHRNPPLLDVHPVHPFLGVSAPIPRPRTTLLTSLGPDSSLRTDLVTLPRTNQQPSAIMRHLPSACGHSTPLMNSSSSGGNIQVVGQGSTMLKPEKPCIYFNTTKGCYNGANCRYLHTKFDQASPSQAEELPNAKRMKLGSETNGSR